ncbi:MAG TPA: phospholipase D-like domain-containing protein [Candidatus Thermoplasmatota archaeon]|nr:phospholipase D-like domain-containing protein [Candidatus Thermoplasmatota archaeon]
MRALVPLLLLFALPGQAQPWLVAVAPDLPGPGPGDEGFAVAGPPGGMDLGGYRVTDGEGAYTFPPGTTADAVRWVWVTGNGTAWKSHAGPPALRWDADHTGRFGLANDGEGLELLDAQGLALDAFAWGDGQVDGMHGSVRFTSPGIVYERRRDGDGFLDTDSPEDWATPRLHRIGESGLDQPTFHVQRLTLYSSPDSSFEVLTGLIAGARERLHLHVYELRSPALVDALVAAKAAHPRLDLQLLAEGHPVGIESDERHATADALRRIQEAGGTVVLADGGRYRYHHLKVLVADGAVAVQSENWVEAGVPEEPTWGNRGWGAVVHDRAAADWFAAWMAADRAAWDVEPFDLAAFDPLFEPPPRYPPRTGGYGPVVPALTLEGDFLVTPVVAPDHTADPADDLVAHLAATARRRLWVEQLDLAVEGQNRLGWTGADPLLAAAVEAERRGADVRLLAASPFSADDRGNADALAWLAERGVAARFLDRPGIATLHNKGLVADDAVVLGSLNANHASRSDNREVSLILQGPGVADPFASLFSQDWGEAEPPRDFAVIRDDLRGLPAAPWPTLLALPLVASLLSRR